MTITVVIEYSNFIIHNPSPSTGIIIFNILVLRTRTLNTFDVVATATTSNILMLAVASIKYNPSLVVRDYYIIMPSPSGHNPYGVIVNPTVRMLNTSKKSTVQKFL